MEVLASTNKMSAITFLSLCFSSKNGTRTTLLTILVWHITILTDLFLIIPSLLHFYCCLQYQFGSRLSLFVTDYIFIDSFVQNIVPHSPSGLGTLPVGSRVSLIADTSMLIAENHTKTQPAISANLTTIRQMCICFNDQTHSYLNTQRNLPCLHHRHLKGLTAPQQD